MSDTLKNLEHYLAKAVQHYWHTRLKQSTKQKSSGKADQGSRSAVTGGAQMDGFIELFSELLIECGIQKKEICYNKSLELPGFFRPTKEWDILLIKDDKLVIVAEAKSQVGPSFGNNFNNRTEEAMGSALDLWTAYREGAFKQSPQPWLGYLFMLEDCPGSQSPVRVQEPHFKVFPEFISASYAKRYELFCQKLIRERHYSSSAFLISDSTNGVNGKYKEPSTELQFRQFVQSMIGHASTYVKT